MCRPVTALIPDELLPVVLVEGVGSAGGKVPLEEGVVAVVPLGELAGSVVFSKGLMTQQEADGKREDNSESSHCPAVLELKIKTELRL